jgi:hypothetical protein
MPRIKTVTLSLACLLASALPAPALSSASENAAASLSNPGAVERPGAAGETVRPLPGKQPGVTLRLAERRTVHGQPFRVTGKLVGSLSRRAGRARVRVLFRAGNSSLWQRLTLARSDRAGRYSARIVAPRNGSIRAVGPDGVSSAAKPVRIRSRLSVGSVKRMAKVGDRVVINGVSRPAGKRRIKVIVRGASRAILRTRTRAHGGFKVSFVPGSSGRHRIRVFGAANGAAGADASRRIRVIGLRPTPASYYGPGLYGNGMACGGTLYPWTRGVAHKTLPCGTKVTLRYEGRTVTVPVVDRGPYVAGREFDLTEATRNDLGFGGVGTVWTNR